MNTDISNYRCKICTVNIQYVYAVSDMNQVNIWTFNQETLKIDNLKNASTYAIATIRAQPSNLHQTAGY